MEFDGFNTFVVLNQLNGVVFPTHLTVRMKFDPEHQLNLVWIKTAKLKIELSFVIDNQPLLSIFHATKAQHF